MEAQRYEDTGLAALAHILGMFTGFLGPLVIYMLRNEEDLPRDQAREVINFQITVKMATIGSVLLIPIAVGILLFLAVICGDLIFSVAGTLAAYRGERYRYPVCLRLLTTPRESPHRPPYPPGSP